MSFFMGVSDHLVEKCCSSIDLDNMNISRLIFMLNKWNKVGYGGRIERPKGPSLLEVVLQKGGWKFKISLDLRRGSLIKFLVSSLRLVMIGCLTLSLKIEEV